MSHIFDLFNRVEKAGVRLELTGDHLKINVLTGGDLPPELLAELKERKEEIIAFLLQQVDDQAIPVQEKREYYPLSSVQRRMVALNQIDPQSVSYNISGIYELEGEVDTERFTQVFRQLVQRHESLRTSFFMLGEQPVQRVLDKVGFELEVFGADGRDGRSGQEIIEAIIDDFIRPFDLGRAPLLRVGSIPLGQEHHILLTDMHHIITDGTSMGIIIQDFLSLYAGEEPGPLAIQYKDFAEWKNQTEYGPSFSGSMTFWLTQFSQDIPVLELPSDFPRPARQSFAGNTIAGELGERETRPLRQIMIAGGYTLYMVLLATFYLLLGKISGQEDIVVGTPVAGRDRIEIEPVVGMFINTLALRGYPAGHKTFHSFLGEIKALALSAFSHQDYPFENLVEQVIQERDISRNPLFDVMFVLQNMNIPQIDIPGFTLRPYVLKSRIAKFDLTLAATEVGEKILFTLEYSTALFTEETATRFTRYFGNLVWAAGAYPDRPIGDLEIMDVKEKQDLLAGLNNLAVGYPAEKRLDECFRDQVERRPDGVALVGRVLADRPDSSGSTGIISLSYSGLDRRADELAGLLIEKGVLPNTIVGIEIERSIEMVIAILAILKAGGAYLPIDPAYPQERIDYMLADSGAEIVIGPQTVGANCCSPIQDIGAECRGERQFAPTDLAYVIYTSGTTGSPKGVMIDHYNVVRLLFNDRFPFDFSHRDAWSLFHSYCFDFSVWEIFGALLYGGKLRLVPRQISQSPAEFLRLLKREGITVLNQTPSAFYWLAEEELKQPDRGLYLRYVIFGGEALSPGKLAGWHARYPETKLINMYGITETTVHTTYKEIGGREIDLRASNIGKPIPTLSLYVLDKYLALVPAGVPGELCVAGDGVARGYLNRPELTAGRFIRDRFQAGPATHRSGRLYRSGDLARVMAGKDGGLEYLGRLDTQVKIRGHRIELGEIQNRLLGQAGIKDALVTVREDGEEKYLCAYLVAVGKEPGDRPDTSLLREFLGRSLPDYMIPAYFVWLPHMPLTANGKVDRKALPDPAIDRSRRYLAPRDEVEEKLIRLWEQVLRRKGAGIQSTTSPIGIDDDFFHLGGHSLKATSLIVKIQQELGVTVPLAEVFKHPTPRRLALFIRGCEVTAATGIKAVEKREYYPLSSAQRRIYILQQMDPGLVVYNIPAFFNLEGEIDPEKFERTFCGLIARHESLRTSFFIVEEEPVQRIYGQVAFELEEYEMKGHKRQKGHKGQELIETIARGFIRPFDLGQPPLVRAGILRLSDRKHLLLLDTHHIVSDGLSMAILVRDFICLYGEKEIAPLAIQYKDFAVWQRQGFAESNHKKQEEYWLSELSGELPVLQLPYDFLRPASQDFSGDIALFQWEAAWMKAGLDLANDYGATLYMVLMAVFGVLLARLSGQEDIVVGTPTAGRRQANLENIIGMFVNTLAIRSNPINDRVFSDYLREIKEKSLAAFDNQDVQFEELVERLSIRRDAGRNPLFDVMFVLQELDIPEVDLPGLRLSPYRFSHRTAKFDLTLAATRGESGLVFSLEYSTALFKGETMGRFIGYYQNIWRQVMGDPQVKLGDIELLDEEEKRRLLVEFSGLKSGYPPARTLMDVFEEQAARAPDRTAVVGSAGLPAQSDCSEIISLSYSGLDRRTDDLAGVLMKKGVLPNTIVGIEIERSIEMVIAILAILKAGGAYLPIDPAYPQERIDYMLADSGAGVVIGPQTVGANCCSPILDIGAECRGERQFAPTDLAYVIYTSGSTGRPKGVLVDHASAFNVLSTLQRLYPFCPDDTYLLKTSFLFDVSVAEIFGWFFGAGRLAVLDRGGEKDPQMIIGAVEKYRVTHINFVPSMFHAFLASLDPANVARLKSLHYLFLAGEALLPETIRQLRSAGLAAVAENLYGPTEGTVYSSYYPLADWDGQAAIPIGRPVPHGQLFILDKRQKLLPLGVAGELWIGGAGLARGYLNNPELTAEKFVGADIPIGAGLTHQSPSLPAKTVLSFACGFTNCGLSAIRFSMPVPGIAAAPRLYKTGDLCRWLADGNIEFLGRLDFQVKIRGFRIELGEIEAQLVRHPWIKEAVVVAYQGEFQDNYLCAYLAIRPADPETKLNPGIWREFLAGRLPDYMIPAYFVVVPQFSLTPTGKVDRLALPKPTLSLDATAYRAPENPVEEALVNIWAGLLSIDRDKIGSEQNFFDLGGHSLKATIMISRIHKVLDIRIPLAIVFKYPSIRVLAAYIRGLKKETFAAIGPTEEKEYYPLSSAQRRLFLYQQIDPGSAAYNQLTILCLEGDLKREKLDAAFKGLIARHESLRTSFFMLGEQPVQRVYGQVAFELEVFGAAGRDGRSGQGPGLGAAAIPGTGMLNRIAESPQFVKPQAKLSTVLAGSEGDCCESLAPDWQLTIIQGFIRPFNLDRAPLMRLGLIREHEHRHILLVDMHHIVTDGVSLGILAREFMALYSGQALPGHRLHYRDFARWQQGLKESVEMKRQEAFWLAQFKDDIPVLNLPTDFARPSRPSTRGGAVVFDIGRESMAGIRDLAAKTGSTIYMVLLSASAVLLSIYSGQDDLVVGASAAGRSHTDLENIIGMFVNMLPLRLRPKKQKTYSEFLREVREISIQAFGHQDYQFEDLIRALNLPPLAGRNPLIDVVFNMLNMDIPEMAIPGLVLKPFPVDYDLRSRFDLVITAGEKGDSLVMRFNYAADLFTQSSIEAMAGHFREILATVIQDRETRIMDIGISSRLAQSRSSLREEETQFAF